MEKIVLLKSVYVGIQEEGTPGEVQVQRIERWTGLPDGAVIPDTYLPLERFTLANATDEQQASLQTALGDVAHGQALAAETAQQQLLEAHGQLAAVQIERDELLRQLAAATAEASHAAGVIASLQAEAQANQSQDAPAVPLEVGVEDGGPVPVVHAPDRTDLSS